VNCGEDHCVTCSDEGTPMRVLELQDAVALCADEHGVTQSVAVDLVAPVRPGADVLVHAGVAIALLSGGGAGA
jgi:hydrogenase assembly chaperone HypC/HupF